MCVEHTMGVYLLVFYTLWYRRVWVNIRDSVIYLFRSSFESTQEMRTYAMIRPSRSVLFIFAQVKWASAQSGESLRCSHEEALGP